MLDIVEAGQSGNNVFFNWNVNNTCQYKCSYCYATGTNIHQTTPTVNSSFALALHKLSRLDFDWDIDLQGGEPTLHSNIQDIIQALERMERCKSILLATNFTKGVDFFTQFDNPSTKLSVHVSYHPEYHKNIIGKIRRLHATIHHVNLFVEVILYPKQQYFAQTVEFLTALQEANVPHGVNIARPNEFWDGIYEDGFYELFNPWLVDQSGPTIPHLTLQGQLDLDENYIIKHNISYRGMKCEQRCFTVQPNADIINTCTYKKLPIKPTATDFMQQVICPHNTTCSCSVMLRYKKVR